jgi:diaminohydroxyphosphoribosylaminopyrimidine deaminase/5-amino-6-(5-phosphoribosylamino)uracil reductase
VETPRQPLRVIADSHLETPPQARILQGEKILVFSAKAGSFPNAEVVIMKNENNKVDLPKMLQELARRGVNELHVEAGFKLNGSLLRESCVDELLVYLNPSLLGDSAQGMVNLPEIVSLDRRIALKIVSLDRIGDDLRIVARL